jgi:hypothetical protein
LKRHDRGASQLVIPVNANNALAFIPRGSN